MKLVIELDDAWLDRASDQCQLPEALRGLLQTIGEDITDRDHDLAEPSTITEPYIHSEGRIPTHHTRTIATYQIIDTASNEHNRVPGDWRRCPCIAIARETGASEYQLRQGGTNGIKWCLCPCHAAQS